MFEGTFDLEEETRLLFGKLDDDKQLTIDDVDKEAVSDPTEEGIG
jgi:hypothetical protein